MDQDKHETLVIYAALIFSTFQPVLLWKILSFLYSVEHNLASDMSGLINYSGGICWNNRGCRCIRVQ